jgi:arylsulfatase A-like enzyme
MAEFIDMYPCFCDLAGMAKPHHLHGSSLVPILEETSDR